MACPLGSTITARPTRSCVHSAGWRIRHPGHPGARGGYHTVLAPFEAASVRVA
jgi:hypothetical protein